MSDVGRDPTTDAEVAEAARRAGWNPDWGPCPVTHGVAPAIDPALGNNGISPEEMQRQWIAHRKAGR